MSTLPANIAAMLQNKNITTTDSMESGGGSVPRISLFKSKFTAKNGDQETKLGEEIHVVIVGVTPEHGFSKTWYEGAYQPGSSEPPDCQSTDGVRPDGFVSKKQSDLCANCQQNQWGSATSMSGKKAKACKDSKRLYVKLAAELDDADAPTYMINVAVMSLKPFGQYGKELAKEGIPTPAIVITKLSFDEDAAVPVLKFTNEGILEEAHCAKALELAEAKDWEYKPAAVNDKQTLDAPTEAKTVADGNVLENW